MSDTATAHHDDGHLSLNNDNKKLLMWLFLGSDCMFFGTLISTHLIYRKIYPESFDPTSLFSLELTSFSTFILLMSSFLMAQVVLIRWLNSSGQGRAPPRGRARFVVHPLEPRPPPRLCGTTAQGPFTETRVD